MADLNEPQQMLAALRTALEQLTQDHDSTRQAIGDMEEAAADLQEVLTKLRRMQVDPEGIAQIQGVCIAVEALAAQCSDLCTLLSDRQPRHATVTAVTPCTLYKLHRDDLRVAMATQPVIRQVLEEERRRRLAMHDAG